MGVDTHDYIGPYMEACTPLVEHKDDQCKKPQECPNSGSGFCPACGIDTEKRYRIRKGPEAGRYSIMEITNDALMGTDIMCDPPEINGVFTYRIIPNAQANRAWDDDDTINLLGTDMEAECDEFAERYKAEIEKVKAVFGPVEIRWGYLRWYS